MLLRLPNRFAIVRRTPRDQGREGLVCTGSSPATRASTGRAPATFRHRLETWAHRPLSRAAVLQPVAAMLFLLLLGSSCLALACGEDTSPTGTGGSSADTGAPPTGAGASVVTGGSSGRPVSFVTEDGVTLRGHLFGTGKGGVVLAHMYPADQTSWYSTAERLAESGYLALTFDFRGYGESEGEKEIKLIDRDVLAAISAIAEAGAQQVVLVGASMGGTASLIAADKSQTSSPIPVSGVVTLSAPVEFKGLSAAEAVPRLRIPLLFIAAEDDAGADSARQLQQLATSACEVQLVPGDDHGTELLQGSQAEKVWNLLSAFIERNLPEAAQ